MQKLSVATALILAALVAAPRPAAAIGPVSTVAHEAAAPAQFWFNFTIFNIPVGRVSTIHSWRCYAMVRGYRYFSTGSTEIRARRTLEHALGVPARCHYRTPVRDRDPD